LYDKQNRDLIIDSLNIISEKPVSIQFDISDQLKQDSFKFNTTNDYELLKSCIGVSICAFAGKQLAGEGIITAVEYESVKVTESQVDQAIGRVTLMTNDNRFL